MLPTIHRAELASVTGGRIKHIDDIATLQPVLQQLGEALKAAMQMKTANEQQMFQAIFGFLKDKFQEKQDAKKSASGPKKK